MAEQNQNGNRDKAAPDADRMTGIIDSAKTISAKDLHGHEDDAREDGDRTKRAVDRMATGNTPRAGDDPQHGNNSNLTQTPLPSDTGGKGHVGDTPVKDDA